MLSLPTHAKRPSDRDRTGPALLRIPLVVLLSGATLLSHSKLEAQEATVQIEYQFDQPEAPGDSFSLRYTVPTGYESAVLIGNRTDEESTENPEQETGITSALILPLPGAGESAWTGLDGIVPESVTTEELEQSIVDIRIVLFNPQTGEILLSDPIPLSNQGLNPGGSDEVDEALTSVDMAVSEENPGEGDGSDESGDPDSSESDVTPYSVATAELANGASFGTLALRVIAEASLKVSIHDQPTPVQGSGH